MATIIDPPNSVWPNGLKVDSEGYVTFYPLGTNKVDISTVTWPTGDKLISPFVYQSEKLVGFCDTEAVTVVGRATVNIPYDYFEASLPLIPPGSLTFNSPTNNIEISYFNGIKLGSKYIDCTGKPQITAIEPDYITVDIVNGIWNQSLKNVTGFSTSVTAKGLFQNCTTIKIFVSDLNKVASALRMFMGCSSLIAFSADLGSLERSNSMFSGCKNLTTFISNISSLQYATNMFGNCKLNSASIKNIIDTIPEVTPYDPPAGTTGGKGKRGYTTLGMGCDSTEEGKTAFAQEIGYSDIDSLLNAISSKGWILTVQYNGGESSTYDLRNKKAPIFAKIEESEEYYSYTSIDGSKKYHLDWFHETTGSTAGYTQFNSLEEAIEHFNIKPIERN